MGPGWEKPETPFVPTIRGLTYYNHSPSLERSVTFHQRTENPVFEKADPLQPHIRSPAPPRCPFPESAQASAPLTRKNGPFLASTCSAPTSLLPDQRSLLYPRPQAPTLNPHNATLPQRLLRSLSRVLPSCAHSPLGLPPPWVGGGKPKAL